MRPWILCLAFLVAGPAFAGDRWVLISGTVGVFHTDARVFNPSFDKDIQVTAKFLPAGNPPVDNSGAMAGAGVTFTVPKRSMHILNDVTSVLFGTNSLGAIFFTSADDIEVTSRIYAQTASGTLGQFGPGLNPSSAKTKAAILQMKANGGPGQIGTFRTNMGLINPAGSSTTVNLRLYDSNNELAGTGELTLPPFGATTPIALGDGFFWDVLPGAQGLGDAWVSYVASQPIFAYASVVDNGTTDQTFVPAVDDTGVAPTQQPPQARVFDVMLEDFSITFSPALTDLQVGDQVTFRIRRLEGTHGFQMLDPSSSSVIPDTRPGTTPVERTFTIPMQGTYTYFCTVVTCDGGSGAGHNTMFGSFNVGESSGSGPGY